MPWSNTGRWSCRGATLFPQIGSTHLQFRRGCRLEWMSLLWHPQGFGPRRKNSKESQMNGKNSLHPQVATTMTQRKSFQTPSRRHSLKRKRWAWLKVHSPNRRRRTDVGVSLVNSVLGQWRPSMKETKRGKIRTIYDGSFGGANAHIQQNSTEKTTAPTVMDCVHGIHWLRAAGDAADSGTAPSEHGATAGGVDPMSKGSVWHWQKKDSTFLLLKADVSKAHTRIKILKSGWKYQVAQIDQQWWVNKVGTYGIASAQLYWGRMAALLLRIVYSLLIEVDWGFVFVDDFCWILRASNSAWLTPALLGVLLALGTPLSWKKTVLSEINTWLGFVINPSGPFVQMAKDKHVAVLALLKELEEGKVFSFKAIEKALGKIQWATATCPMAKPFLQPFWAWKPAVKTARVPGKLVRCLAVLLSQLFSKQFPQMSPFSPWSSWTGASDASAEKAGDSWIGGWLTDSREHSKDKVLWFQYKVGQELGFQTEWPPEENCGPGALRHLVFGTAADGAESFNIL